MIPASINSVIPGHSEAQPNGLTDILAADRRTGTTTGAAPLHGVLIVAGGVVMTVFGR